MSALARRRNRDTNTWPGFVDALASLLMVIIFVLMIFIVAQFYLTQILSGKDESLARLNQQISELTDLLSLEREANAELRVTVAQLSAELQSSLATRDRLTAQVDRLTVAQATLESRLAELTRERAVLQGRIDSLESSRTGVDARLLEVLKERDALLGKLAAVEEKERIATSERDAIAADLDRALQVVDANRATIELQLRDLERLRRDLAAIRAVRDDLESQVAALAALRERLRADLDDANRTVVGLQADLSAANDTVATLETDLSDERALAAALRAEVAQLAQTNEALRKTLAESETSKDTLQADLTQALAALQALRTERAALEAAREALRQELSAAATRIATLDRDLATANRNTEALLEDRSTLRGEVEKAVSEIAGLTQSLGVARDTTKALEARLAEQSERTLLAQREIDERDIRLEELFSELTSTQATLTQTQAALSVEEEVSTEAQQQVAILNAQIAALREQLARIERVLEISERENEEKRTRIVDLGRRLNAALATKVQELARFRSEFFGRLREVLSGRQDIRVVGDRFVFQSEVLFESGSAEIGLDGQQSLGQLADTLQEIAARIPQDINWILQIEGHTDSIPIYNESFANNWELSAARAISVVEYLIERGIPASRLSATGYGEFQPIDAANLNRNRRIELKLTQR